MQSRPKGRGFKPIFLMKLRESIDNALLKNAEPPLEFMNKLSKDKGLENCLVSYFFQKLMNEITMTDDRQNDISYI
jgi:hypothetical protein